MARADDSNQIYATSSSSSTYTDSPLYGAESWERTGASMFVSSTENCLYNNNPRMTRQQQLFAPNKPTTKPVSRSTGLCSDSLKEKCSLVKIVCSVNFKMNGCPCQMKQMYKQYFFFSKSLILILLMNALFSTAVLGITTEIVKKVIEGPEYILLRTLLIHGVTQVLFPIGGHLADLYIGHHRMVRCSIWMAWIGLAILCLIFSSSQFNNNPFTKFGIFPVSALLLSVSYVCFMPSIIPLGLDQLQGASHIHYSSFFYWWYWTLNIGFSNIPQYCTKSNEIDLLIHAEFGLICLTIALILDALFQHWLVIEPVMKGPNPLIQIVQILKDACCVSSTQRIPSTVFHEINIKQFGRMDQIKKRYGGKYEIEQVEDVKTFFRVLVVITGIGISTFIYTGVFDTIEVMAFNMNGTFPSVTINTDLCHVNISLLSATNALILAILIPILDLFVVPLLRYVLINPSIMKRLGFGSFLAFGTALSIFVLHTVGNVQSRLCIFQFNDSSLKMDVNIFWILVPVVILTISEVFIYIPGYEFICAQTPYNMRGLLIGVFFSVQGIFSILSVLLQYLFMISDNAFPIFSCGGWYYFVIMCCAVFGFVFYLFVACNYKRRKRDNLFNSVALIEEHYASLLSRRNE